MMPEGVEHSPRIAASAELLRVTDSMMPEGVEHEVFAGGAATARLVTDSMMPEGVEHPEVQTYFSLPRS
mgnify:CR=1 FL=1